MTELRFPHSLIAHTDFLGSYFDGRIHCFVLSLEPG